ncbi:MAG TPA: RES family NAD+ phosphorylase [Cyclobacteriaceae bacterium]|nr:RES family NAD+ phosphorylase [Cyclobacteriaceae bacterium]
MIVFRLCKSRYADSLTGLGAEKAGGRWNDKEIAIIYTSESRALCTAEIAVHTPLGNIPDNYQLVKIEIPEHSILEIKTPKLPNDWRSFPYPVSTRKLGNEFVSNNRFLVMKVPSAVVQDEYNYLINPGHTDFKKVGILSKEVFVFDERLFRK